MELAQRIDKWLLTEIHDWREEFASDRLIWLRSALELARETGMNSELDYALFARLLADHRPNWRAFVNEPQQQEILTCKRRHSGAKIRELSLLSEMHQTNRSADEPRITA